MSSGEMSAHSELGTRDESKQTRNFGNRIQKLKTVCGLNARVLVMKDVVIPFNPFTGEEDDSYNRKTPFRPILLVSQVLEGLISVCKENEAVNAVWNKELGIDLSSVNPADEEELMKVYLAFKPKGFIKPRVMTYHTVAMNFGGIFGFPEFRVKYTVDSSQLNAEGTYDYGPNAPYWHQAAIFFNAMLKPEADAKRQALEKQGASKEVLASERSNVYKRSPVGFVGPTNLIPFFYFPFDADVPTFKADDFHAVEEHLRFFSFTDKWTVSLREAMEKKMFDTCIDFFDFHIRTPSSKEQKPSGGVYTDDDSMELYTAMSISITDGRLNLTVGSTELADGTIKPNRELYASFMEAAKAYFLDSQGQSDAKTAETFEAIMAKSSRFRPINAIMDNFLPACNEVFVNQFASSPYCTEEVKKANSTFFTAMNPANAIALASSDEEELEDAAQEQAASVSDLIADTKAPAENINLIDAEFGGDTLPFSE